MPNWCANRVTISGDKEQIDVLIEMLETESQVFDFNKVIPMPEEIKGVQTGLTEISGKQVTRWRIVDNDSIEVPPEEMKELVKRYRADNLYDWAYLHWGTKWNACEALRSRIDDELVQYNFDTAWAPPEPIAAQLTVLFPHVSFTWFYDEPGAQIAGYL